MPGPKSGSRTSPAPPKGADKLILATDPDREGEAISWHILEVLKERKVAERDADRAGGRSMRSPSRRSWKRSPIPARTTKELVDAYLARRALDYLVGFTLSPVLWRKLPGARSAGRVQTVALRLVVEREQEIEALQGAGILEHRYATWRRRASGNFDRPPGSAGRQETSASISSLASEADADRAVAAIEAQKFTVGSVEAKPVRRNPSPPFKTSTLQQEASRKLGFNAKPHHAGRAGPV